MVFLPTVWFQNRGRNDKTQFPAAYANEKKGSCKNQADFLNLCDAVVQHV